MRGLQIQKLSLKYVQFAYDEFISVSVCVSAWSTYLRYYILTDATGLYMVLLAQMPEKAMQLRPAYVKKKSSTTYTYTQ